MSELQLLLQSEYRYRQRPHPIPAELRTDRKTALLLLLVAKCHGSGASWKTLHVLNWAVRSERNFRSFDRVRQGDAVPDVPIVRIEPALDRSLDLSVGLGYLERKDSGSFRLLDAGKQAIDRIEESGALAMERGLLARLPGKVTHSMISELLEGRSQ